MMKVTKETIKEIMKTTGQKLLYEDEMCLEYENSCGEAISFDFKDGILIEVYS